MLNQERDFEITSADGRELRFRGRVLAHATSRMHAVGSRWNEVFIYDRTPGYVVDIVGESTVSGETSIHRAVEVMTAPEVVDALRRPNGRLTRVALAALEEAGKVDVQIRLAAVIDI